MCRIVSMENPVHLSFSVLKFYLMRAANREESRHSAANISFILYLFSGLVFLRVEYLIMKYFQNNYYYLAVTRHVKAFTQ